MSFDHVSDRLSLSDRERGLLEVLLESVGDAVELRLPPELVLVAIRIDVGRPEDWASQKLPRDRAHTGSEYH